MLLDGVVYSRKRRDAFNEHALHQTVAPSSHDPEEPPSRPAIVTEAASGQRSVALLHEPVPGKVVHDPEHDADDPPPAEGAVDLSTAAVEVAEDASPRSPGSTTPLLAPLLVNVSATTANYYSHDLSARSTVALDRLTSSSSPSVDSVRASSHEEESGARSSSVVIDDEIAGNARTSASSSIAENSGVIEATMSASDAESAKLEADSSESTGNDSDVFAANYSADTYAVADSAVEPSVTTMLSEIQSGEPTSDRRSNVGNPSDESAPVEPYEEKVELAAGTASTSLVDVEPESDASSNRNAVKPVEEADGIAEDRGDVSEDKISGIGSGIGTAREANVMDTVNTSAKSAESRTSDVVKETRELPREHSSSESEASSNIVKTPEERPEELQGDYPVPIYSYGQDEVEIVNLQQKKRPLADVGSSDAKIIGDAKVNAASRKGRDKDDLRIIMRQGSDEEFLRKFEEKFHEASIELEESAEDPSLFRTDDDPSPASTVHETLHETLYGSSGNASPGKHPSNSPMTQRVQIVEVPVYHDDRSSTSSSSSSSSSSPHRVLINVTIATGDSDAASSRPLYVLSVSVPTEVDATDRSSGINVEQAQVHAAEPPASMKKIPVNDGESIGAIDTRLPPPPQPPASPPAPIWAGGECECSCPCMGSSSDEWDNFSALDDDESEEIGRVNSTLLAEKSPEPGERSAAVRERLGDEERSAAKDSASISPVTEDYYPSSMDDTVENSGTTGDTTATPTYEPQVSTGIWACSGTTSLPPEPTILILEGEAPFTIVSVSSFSALVSSTLFFSLSSSLVMYLFACLLGWSNLCRSVPLCSRSSGSCSGSSSCCCCCCVVTWFRGSG